MFDFFDFGFTFGGLGDLSQLFLTKLLQGIIAAFSFAIVTLWNFVTSALKVIGQFFQTIGAFLNHLWQNFFKQLLTHPIQFLRTLQQWLERHLRPILNFLRRIRALQDAYFRHYLKPLLDMLQHVRQFLQLLRLLHVQFAAQLDNYIAGLEARLATTFATLRAAVNNAIDVVNLLADPTLLIRKPVLLLSIRRQLPALIAAVTGRPPGYWFPSPRGSGGGAFAPVGSNYLPSDPSQNPKVSSYLGYEDGITNTPPLDIGFTVGVTVVDHVDIMDYFNDALYPAPTCTDPAKCLDAAIHAAIGA